MAQAALFRHHLNPFPPAVKQQERFLLLEMTPELVPMDDLLFAGA
jgi:hypothetical protein